MEPTRMRFQATPSRGEVGALLLTPPSSSALLVLAHGAGAGMEHPFMGGLAQALADRSIATFRYQFSYTETNAKRPDPAPVLEATVRAAVAAASAAAPDLPLFAGGKSMGGRMTSRAAAGGGVDVRGIVFFGFPLHGAGRAPTAERAEHLAEVSQPMLFLQGTRDSLAELGAIRALCAGLPRATLHVVDGADHGFHVPKRSGRDDAVVIGELADATAGWMKGIRAGRAG
jgi:predicted alpha/beta-hydrolase family hydrolase